MNFDFDGLDGGTNGAIPNGGLTQASDGKLYGTASSGGKNNYGVIFSFDPSTTTYTNLYDFDFINGGNPNGSLIQTSDGKLYGMTHTGGSNSNSVIFSFDPYNRTYTKLKEFDYTNGAMPTGSLIQASAVKQYGMTTDGGATNGGVIFSFDPSDATYSKLWDFDGVKFSDSY